MLEILSTITITIAGIYFLIGFLLQLGLSKKYNRTKETPAISVLIAARNEEKYLPLCLRSLKEQDYPSNLVEIIILNDQSTDNTREIALSFCNAYPNFRLIDIEEERDGLKGKMNVLAQGIDIANGDILLVTDADCIIPQNWVSAITSYFSEKTGLVAGLTILDRSGEKVSLFDHLQCIDWLFLQAVASGTAGLGLPVSLLGNNFGFRKSAYKSFGGYKNMKFSLTEDMALLQAIHKLNKYDIVYPLNMDTSINSFPVNRWSDFYKQRRRWAEGGRKTSLWGWLMMIVSFTTHLLLLVSIISLNLIPMAVIGCLLILSTDLFLSIRIFYRLNRLKYLTYFLFYEMFYSLYLVVFAISLLLPGSIQWKERRYKNI